MGKSKEDKPKKVKEAKVFTRAQAEKALANGDNPEKFTNHQNSHVRLKAWKKMGFPLPNSDKDKRNFFVSLCSGLEQEKMKEFQKVNDNDSVVSFLKNKFKDKYS